MTISIDGPHNWTFRLLSFCKQIVLGQLWHTQRPLVFDPCMDLLCYGNEWCPVSPWTPPKDPIYTSLHRILWPICFCERRICIVWPAPRTSNESYPWYPNHAFYNSSRIMTNLFNYAKQWLEKSLNQIFIVIEWKNVVLLLHLLLYQWIMLNEHMHYAWCHM